MSLNDVNILFIIAVALFAICAARGWKSGLIEGIVRIVSSILGLCVLLVAAQGIYGFMKGGIASAAVAVAVLAVIGSVHRFVKFITETFKLVRWVPFGKFADRLLGVVLGVAEALCIIWVAFILIGGFDMFGLQGWLMGNIGKSRFLQMLYDVNYLTLLLQRLVEWVYGNAE